MNMPSVEVLWEVLYKDAYDDVCVTEYSAPFKSDVREWFEDDFAEHLETWLDANHIGYTLYDEWGNGHDLKWTVGGKIVEV